MNFIYNLLEAHEGVHADFFLQEGRPLSGDMSIALFPLKVINHPCLQSFVHVPRCVKDAMCLSCVQRSGGNATLLVTVAGSDSVKIPEVTLYDSSGPTEVTGTLQACWITFFNIDNSIH